MDLEGESEQVGLFLTCFAYETSKEELSQRWLDVCLDSRGEFQAGGLQLGVVSVLMVFQVLGLAEIAWEVTGERSLSPGEQSGSSGEPGSGVWS